MRPSPGITYAIKALVDLALHQGSGPVTVGSMARRQGIPLRYLEQLLNRLRRRGIVAAERGPRGGYQLGVLPSKIPISAIFECLESKALHPRRALSAPAGQPDPTAPLWRQLETAVQTTLKATTLEDLVSQARQNARFLDHSYTFHI
ncbi:MAG: Rrf2 family transcriptional regulator [Candidatus Omnitrophica bacterium]|nr:Rrf2 family transcriptional regulator [Candidatus Omnitrophota bacterium]